MKILMCIPGTPHSPIAHRSVAIGRELVKRGHDVTMLAPSADKYSKWQFDRPATFDGVKMRYPFQLRTKIQIIDLIPYIIHGAIISASSRFDIAHSYKSTPASLPAIFAKLRGAKVVLDMDDLDAEVMRTQGQPAVMWRLVALSERIIASSATGFIVASRLLQREYEHRFAGKPTLRIPNAVDPKDFPQAPSLNRPPRLIFFGILGRTSILAPLLEATAQIKPQLEEQGITVDILGDGPCRPELEAMSKKLGTDEVVNFHGWATYKDFQDTAARDDIAICIMPDSRTTAACSNQKVFQYMALGLAPIVSRVGDLPLYVADGEAGLVIPPSDAGALADAITKLINDPTLRHNLAVRAHDRVIENYTWAAHVDKIAPFLESLQ